MEKYEQYLSDNAEDDERLAAAQVLEGLAGLRLESKLREVAAEEAAQHRRTLWRRLLFTLAALAFLAAVAYWFFSKNEATPSVPPIEKQAPSSPSPTKKQTPEQNKLEKPRENPPIAQIKAKEEVVVPPDPIFPTFALQDELIPEPLHAAPDLVATRGQGEANAALKALLDQLWYVTYPLQGLDISEAFPSVDENLKKRDFTAAYLELEQLSSTQAANDTLHYLKGYCLLQTGEGQEALLHFAQVQGRQLDWEPQLQWYRSLAMLLADKRSEAIALFNVIAANAGHPYRRQARKALKLLQ
ncbi:MAG TPA: hypothetical protein PLC89_17025 [Haliscomenobacter sp.]|mgnify:CR=1 FL=1|uniref:hypothetical protein n=1 Tax=Haliscomenobacter sp. TaxID=2717303 RepID=UPI002CDF4F7A|nr:hypothetical protein [Haliscomenobacter sp.]HOY19011.1 hypothetical protein [Haliscomenobacter sp.]